MKGKIIFWSIVILINGIVIYGYINAKEVGVWEMYDYGYQPIMAMDIDIMGINNQRISAVDLTKNFTKYKDYFINKTCLSPCDIELGCCHYRIGVGEGRRVVWKLKRVWSLT